LPDKTSASQYLQSRCKHQKQITGLDEQKLAPAHLFAFHAPPLKQKGTPNSLGFSFAAIRPLIV
jgi:hypothetical protein